MKRCELSQQIRRASAQLRSPVAPRFVAPAPPASADAVPRTPSHRIKAEAEAALRARRRKAAARGAPGSAAPCSPPAAAETARVCPHGETGPAAPVDLRALRQQMERSLAQLEAGAFSPTADMAAAEGHDRSCLHVVPLKATTPPWRRAGRRDGVVAAVEHFVRRRDRSLAQALFWRWSSASARSQLIILQQLHTQLQEDMEDVEVQLAVYEDPERMRAVDELTLRLFETNAELEALQGEREDEKIKWQQNQEIWTAATAAAAAADEAALEREADREIERQREKEELRQEIDNLKAEAEASSLSREALRRENEAMRAVVAEYEDLAAEREKIFQWQESVDADREALQREREALDEDKKLLEDQQLRLLVERKVTGPRNTDAQNAEAGAEQTGRDQENEREQMKADRKRWRQMSRIWMDGKLRAVGKVLKFRVYSLWLRYSVRSVRKRGLLEQSMAFGQALCLRSVLSAWVACRFDVRCDDQDKLSPEGLLVKAASVPETFAQQLVFEKSQDKANADHFPGPVEISQGKRVTETVSRGHQSKCKRATRAILQELDRLAAQTGTPEIARVLARTRNAEKENVCQDRAGRREREEFESNNTCDEEKMNGALQQNLQEAEEALLRLLSPSSGLKRVTIGQGFIGAS